MVQFFIDLPGTGSGKILYWERLKCSYSEKKKKTIIRI